MTTPVAHISLTPSLTFLSLTPPLSRCLSSFLGHQDQSKQRKTGFEDEADGRGLKSRGKASRRARKKKEGGAELNLQVWLLGHLPVSPRCPLLYLSTCSFCLLSSPPLLFLSFPWSTTGQSLVGDGFPACLATHRLPSACLVFLFISLYV